jgi:hypothetical protein
MDDVAITRALYVLAVAQWIGGVAFVKTVCSGDWPPRSAQ